MADTTPQILDLHLLKAKKPHIINDLTIHDFDRGKPVPMLLSGQFS